jgi:cellulase
VSGWTCKAQNAYYSQCVQGEGNGNGNGNGNAAQPTATKPTAVASSAAPIISKEAVKPTASAAPAADKLWTMEELIAFLEKAE